MSRVLQRALASATAIIVLAASGVGCGREGSEPAVPAPRVVSLVPAATAIIDALGAKAHLVGITRYSEVEGPPVIGGMDARPEAVVARSPDLVVLGDYPSQKAQRDQLEALELKVIAPSFVRVTDMKAAIAQLGAALGRDAQAQALADALEADLAEAARRAAGRRSLKVLLVYDVQQGYVYTTGGGDHLSELLSLCGAKNIAAGGPLTTRLALDAVLARAPDVILHVAPWATYADDEAARAFWKSLPEIPAVKTGHVYVWPDNHLAQNGPWIGAAAVRLSELLDRVASSAP